MVIVARVLKQACPTCHLMFADLATEHAPCPSVQAQKQRTVELARDTSAARTDGHHQDCAWPSYHEPGECLPRLRL